ncbi:MAG: hypothetical protein AAF649_05495 [Verrucomicrobiota bacterium]
MTKRTLFFLKLTPFVLLAMTTAAPAHPSAREIADAAQQAHHIQAWAEKEIVRAEVSVLFAGAVMVDGTFTFEAHGGRARYDRKDGVNIIYDGTTAWVSPGTAEAPMGRFHVLTWPWFVMAPFRMQGDGITLSQPDMLQVDGTNYDTVYQTFAADAGDTPDDWYRFFIHPETGLIDKMSYIVTYGKDAETANQQPSIIYYSDYTTGEEPRIAQQYEFWLWDPDTRQQVGDSPKGTGVVRSITYLKHSEADFSVPAGATELALP